MSRLAKVTITYCSECGYEPQTTALVNALLMECGSELSSVEILPWHDGSFDVSVGGELIHSMPREGGFPEHIDIIEAVRRYSQAD